MTDTREIQQHPHAEAIAALAIDALTHPRPWELWEYKYGGAAHWCELGGMPRWHTYLQYRHKPRFVTIGDRTVPAPVKQALRENERYFCPFVTNINMFYESTWESHKIDIFRLDIGVIHLSKANAIMHTEALIAFTDNRVKT